MELVFVHSGHHSPNRFEVKSRGGDVWLVVPVMTEYGLGRQRKLLCPRDAVELGSALVSEGLRLLPVAAVGQ